MGGRLGRPGRRTGAASLSPRGALSGIPASRCGAARSRVATPAWAAELAVPRALGEWPLLAALGQLLPPQSLCTGYAGGPRSTPAARRSTSELEALHRFTTNMILSCAAHMDDALATSMPIVRLHTVIHVDDAHHRTRPLRPQLARS